MLRRWQSARAGKTGANQAHELGREFEQRIEAATRRHLVDMAGTLQALEPGWEGRVETSTAFIIQAASMKRVIRFVRTNGIPDQQPALRFQASSLFLKDCRDLLISDPHGRERLHLVSGTISDNGVRVMSRIVNVDMDEANPAYVRAEPNDTHRKIVQLVERNGHQLFAMFHSHIMRGANSTRPSGVDIANQDRFSAMGWNHVVGGIFSLDGYIRLFSTVQDFEIALYGKGADLVTDTPREKIIKLTPGA